MALSSTACVVLCYALDVADSAAVAALCTVLETGLDRSYIGVTNSGSPPSNPVKSASPKVWQATADPLLISNHLFAGELCQRMQKNKGRRLITIAWSAVEQPLDDGLVRSLH